MKRLKRNLAGISAAALACCITVLSAQRAAGSGGFAVDDADVDQPGQCKVESWLSAADNRDRVISISPACTFDLGRPVEFNPQFASVRSGGAWTPLLGLLFKTSIVAAEEGRPGVALKGGPAVDLQGGRIAGAFASLLATHRFNERFRLNINTGWLYEEDTATHRLTWGASFDWKFATTLPLTLIGEVFGQAGRHEATQPSVTDPRAQLGLRYTPVETVDFDVIYGRNVLGENAHWITLGMNVRFNAFGERTAETRPTTPLYRK